MQNIKKDQLEPKKKYASIYDMINLPRKRPLRRNQENIFEKNDPDEQQRQYVTPLIRQNRDQLLENMEKQMEIFQTTHFDFKFPPSKFPQVPEGTRNMISYEQRIQAVQQDTFRPKLSEEQLKQIKQNGTFQVKSGLHNATIPYVWKVTDWLMRGRVNIVNVWENGLCCIYSMFVTAVDNFVTVIPQSLSKLVHLPVKLFALIFGKKSITPFYTPDYQRQVQKDFWTDIFNNELKNIRNQISHQFLQLLYLKYQPALYQTVNRKGKSHEEITALENIRQQKIQTYNMKKQNIDQLKQNLRSIQNKFEQNWLKIRKRQLMKITTSVEQDSNQNMLKNQQKQANQKQRDKIVVQRFYQQKYLLYTAYLKQNLPKQNNLSGKSLEALLTLIIIVTVIQSKINKKNISLSNIHNNIIQQIKRNYSIRSKNDSFLQSKQKQLYGPIQKQAQDQFNQYLLQDDNIRKYINVQFQSIYKKYLQLNKNKERLIKQKQKTMKCLYEPTRIFKSTYILLPPYQVVNNNGYYSLIKQKQMTIDTSTHFWKFKLYCMRLKSWTINCAVFLLGFAWVGPFGLRCLCGVQNFAYDQNVNYTTGEKIKIERQTVLGLFRKVLQGIKDSRNNFQALPDRGLFGKNCSRLCNLIECYIFRLIFVGIIGVLLLYPIAIIILSQICILFVLTVWIWVPLIMLLTYLFNILIFQFETSRQISGIIIRGIPLLSLLILFIYHLFKCLAVILFLLLVVPIVSLFYFIILIIQRLWRTFTDNLMICIIGCLGRTPSRDTAIARKVSGPGMSRNQFFSIFEDDVYILTQCALQKILMNKFIQLTTEQIQRSGTKYDKIVKFTMKPFGYQRPSINYNKDVVNKNKQQLLNHFNKKSQHYMARYPNYPYQIRFTQQEIDTYFENSVKIVKNFVERQKLKQWVFDERQVLYEQYDDLTRSIWSEIFNCGQAIFQPLQSIDSRFKLQDQSTSNQKVMRKNVASVMKALQGEVDLKSRRVNFNPSKRSLLDKDRVINSINLLCDIHSANSQINLNLNASHVNSLLVAPKNLQELKAYDEYMKRHAYQSKQGIVRIIEQ